MGGAHRAGWWFERPSDSLRYIVLCRAYAVASIVHLTLPDALQASWLGPNAVYAVGIALLAWRGAIAGWLCCAIGLLVPLLFLEDQLTQSAFLLACAASALLFVVGPAPRGSQAGASKAQRSARLGTALPSAVAGLTLATYAAAVFHKLNHDFFDPAVSCASGGMTILAENWGLPFLAPDVLASVWPYLFVTSEVVLVVALARRPLPGMLLGLLMHIPLTIVFAPAFAFTMLAGWTCLLDEDQLRHLGSVFRRRWPVVIGGGLGLGTLSFGLYMQDHWVVYPWWSLKEATLWVGVAWIALALRGTPPTARWSRPRWGVVVVVALWVAHALVPYTGLAFHHRGAMLSNLRIDHGCWNHLVVPEAARAIEPYARLDEVEVHGEIEGAAALEQLIAERLSDRRALGRAIERWCAAGAGPIRARAEYDGEVKILDDLCDDPYPFGRPWFPGARTHQENLDRACPQQCIH